VAQTDDRWLEVSKSTFVHETDGLAMLRHVVPNASPYRAWTNFEFMDNHDQRYEIDALARGRRRLHLIELEHHTGPLQGSETNLFGASAAIPPTAPRSSAIDTTSVTNCRCSTKTDHPGLLNPLCLR